MKNPTFSVGARLADGTVALWRVDEHGGDHLNAIAQVQAAIVQTKPYKRPSVVLVCIPGGKP